MTETSLLRIPQKEEITLAETITLGKILADSGFFQDSKGAAQAVVKILAARELGFGPIAGMTGVYIVKGKISLSANLIASAIQRSAKYSYKVKSIDDNGCVIEFFEGGKTLGVSSFDAKDAARAQVKDGDNWKKYPRNMFFARAMSNGAKWYTPEIFGGPVYIPEELGAKVDEDGNILESEEPGKVLTIAPTNPTAVESSAVLPPTPQKTASATSETADAATGLETSFTATSIDDAITPRQLVALNALAKTGDIDLDGRCAEFYGCPVNALNRTTASDFVAKLKEMLVKKNFKGDEAAKPTATAKPALTRNELISEIKRGRRQLEKVMEAEKGDDGDLPQLTDEQLRTSYREVGKIILSTLKSKVVEVYDALEDIAEGYVTPRLEGKTVKELTEILEIGKAALKKEREAKV